MKQIRHYFNKWDLLRTMRLVFSALLLIGYYYEGQVLFLLAGVFLLLQAVFNMSCPSGSCTTSSTRTKNSKIIKTEQYKATK
jgi:hypothetical protein